MSCFVGKQMRDGTFNVLKIEYEQKVCPVENFSTRNRDFCMDTSQVEIKELKVVRRSSEIPLLLRHP